MYIQVYLLFLKDSHPEGVVGSDSRGHGVVTAITEGNPAPNVDHLTCRKGDVIQPG